MIKNQSFAHSRIARLFRWGERTRGKLYELLGSHEGESILEIGCNDGKFVALVQERCPGVFIVGCDIDAEAVRRAQSAACSVMSAENLSYPDSSFDKIAGSHVIEHIPDTCRAFAEMERVLKPGGRCVLIYPLEIFRGSNNLFSAWLAYGSPFVGRSLHLHTFTPSKIQRMTAMRVTKKGIFFGPYPTFYTVLQKRSLISNASQEAFRKANQENF